MVVDATIPSLLLLTVLVVAVAGGHLLRVAAHHTHRRARPNRLLDVAPATRCRRVVLLDEHRPVPVAG